MLEQTVSPEKVGKFLNKQKTGMGEVCRSHKNAKISYVSKSLGMGFTSCIRS